MGSNFEEGIARSRSKETNHQNSRGQSTAAKLERKSGGRVPSSGGNPTKGGGINRSLKK